MGDGGLLSREPFSNEDKKLLKDVDKTRYRTWGKGEGRTISEARSHEWRRLTSGYGVLTVV
jgi:hypothetical protein